MGNSPWYDGKFTILRIGTGTRNASVDVDDLSLRDVAGREYLRNGDFSEGGDRWFSYNDFEHLSWHPKNLYICLLIEQGVLGLAGFLMLYIVAFNRSLRGAAAGDGLALGTAAMATGFFVLGGVATLLDVPRVEFLFFFLLLAMLSLGRHRLGLDRQTAERADRGVPRQ